MRRPGRIVQAFLAVTALVVPGSVAVAQDQGAATGGTEAGTAGTIAASIREGSCGSPGDIAALLEDLARPVSGDPEPGEASPEPGGAPASLRTSITDVAMPLTDIVEREHVLSLEDVESGQALACGEIDGPIVDEGLAIAVPSLEDGGPSGIGWLTGLGLEATRVHVFVSPEAGTGPSQPGDDPDEPDGPSPSPSPDAGGGDQPDPEPDPVPEPDVDPGDDIDVDV